MSILLFFLGSVCMGGAMTLLLLYAIASRFEGATSAGEGVLVLLLGSGPLALGILFYLLAWQASLSAAAFP